MGKRPKRKIVLFLVEGKSDREALQLAISELYDQIDESIEVFFPTMVEGEDEKGGDITSKFKVFPNNIEDKIYEFFLKENPIGENRPYYNLDTILTLNVEGIIKRNDQKRKNIDYLSSLRMIKVKQKTVKYSVYYFSSNLDHFLHHDANLDYREKRSKADAFARQYIGNAKGFIERILEDSGASKNMSYDQSWDFIKTVGVNSLQRHTNLDVLLKELWCQENSKKE